MANKTGLDVKCQYCGKEFYVTQTRYKSSKTLTCSAECAANLKKELHKDIRKCEICNKEFIVTKGKRQRFCSIKCQAEWQKTNVGHKNPKFQGETIPCDYCGNLYDIHKYNLDKYEHHFCSIECRKGWHKNVFSQTEEWKEKSKIRGAETVKYMSLNTKPQIIINELLSEMNIEYQNEYNVKYYSVDNYLVNENLMIEVMGDYWHYNPVSRGNKEPNGSQKIAMGKDKSKHSYIKKHYDIEVLYLWEYDIYHNIELCKSLITEYISHKGVINNYHSFNYYLNNGILSLKENLLNTY